jgi:hypothetical protein
MKTIPEVPSIVAVESGQPLPQLLSGRPDDHGLDLLCSSDDPSDAYRLARDRQPRLAIVDKRRGKDCRQHLHAMTASLKVSCFDLPASAHRRRAGLAAREKLMATPCVFTPRQGLAGERGGLHFYVGRGGIAGGSYASRGVHLTA